MKREDLARIFFHLLLAGFTANAANKFFTADLEYEEANHFYADIFEFRGQAPDQYRILPLLGLKVICQWLPFHHAVMLFNGVLAFLVFEAFALLLKPGGAGVIRTFNTLFAILFIYTQYTGWRPDTLGLLALCLLTCLWMLRPAGLFRDMGFLALLIALSFSRTDIALLYAAFFIPFYSHKAVAIPALLIPAGVQAALSWLIFPDAVYYTHTFMLWDNLKGFYVVMNPATWLIAAAAWAWRKEVWSYVSRSFRENAYIYAVFTAYLVLILFVGRVNEYRLYLPGVPLLILVHYYRNGEEKAGYF